MSQISFADAEYAGKRKKTRREVFLEEMELVVPWKVLLKLIEPHYPVAGRGRRPYELESMLRVHLMQNWFALSDPAMEEALYEIASLRSFARLNLNEPIPDETTILNFRHLLEANDLAEDILKAVNALLARKGLLLKRGSIVDATIIAAPSSTKNAEGERDPEMHQTKKGNQWFFGMKAHIGVDADSGLVHTVTTTAKADVEQVGDLLHGKEEQVWADSGYRGAPSRVGRDELQWHIAARPSDIAKLAEGRAKTKVQKTEHRKASMRAKVEHPFRVIKRQFGLVKVRFRGLAKNTAHVVTLFALSNLWMARKQLMAMTGVVRPKAA
jgi:transposase, IS5 family